MDIFGDLHGVEEVSFHFVYVAHQAYEVEVYRHALVEEVSLGGLVLGAVTMASCVYRNHPLVVVAVPVVSCAFRNRPLEEAEVEVILEQDFL